MKRLALNYLIIAAMVFSAAFTSCKSKGSLTPVTKTDWATGITNGDWETPPTRIVVPHKSECKKYTRAAYQGRVVKIRYIGEKKTAREPQDMEYYFDNYETVTGSEYEFVDAVSAEGFANKTLFLYNDSEKWGGVPDNIVFKNEKKYPRLKASKDEIAAMEKLQNGRKIILTEVIADFSIEGKSNRLMLARYKNSKKDGLFQIVLRDHNNDYFTVDYPSQLFDGEPNWRADMGDEIGEWSLYFVGRVAEGLFLVTDWCAAEGCGITTFVAKNGKLENWQDKSIAEASASESQPSKEEKECHSKESNPVTIEAVFLRNDDSDSEGLAYSDYRLPNGKEIKLNGSAPDDVKEGDKVSVTYKETHSYGNYGDGERCYDFETLESVKKIGK